MKQIISILLLTIILSSCGNSQQQKAVELTKKIKSVIKPGAIATTINGYTMIAKINGKV
jgi:PBP1b-binding outer membrane lipoprotein LpoB